jgi:hypothetical protein
MAGCVVAPEDPEWASEHTDSTQEAWNSGAYNPVHQDMTRSAVDDANTYLKSVFYDRGKVVDGNIDTDCTNGYTTWSCGSLDDYYRQDPTDIPALHFMRRPTVSSKAGCEDSKAKILDAAVKALSAYHSGRTNDFNYWIGHATHIIQDSTATGHARRDSNDLHKLLKICVSGSPTPAGACTHSQGTDSDYASNGRTPEYHAGRKATLGFLKQAAILARLGITNASAIRTRLRVVLENRVGKYYDYEIGYDNSGYFNCSGLSDTDKYTPPPKTPTGICCEWNMSHKCILFVTPPQVCP